MISSWGQFCSGDQPLANLLPWGGLTAGQRALLERLSPIQAPVMGFETARQQRWRRADLALLVLSQQPTRWAKVLEPWLADGQNLAADLPIIALTDFLRLDQCRPETWLEVCGELDLGQAPGLMLFKNPLQPLPLDQARDLCLAFAIRQTTNLTGLPVTTIEDDWWGALERSGLELVHQIGINLRERPVQWRLLLSAPSGSLQHLQALHVPQHWHKELKQWPHQLALIGGESLDRCGLEILPRYRSSLNLSELTSAPPGGVEQWPSFVQCTGLLTPERRRQLDGLAAATSFKLKAESSLLLLSGVNHLKLSLIRGDVHDLKAYAGAFARAVTNAAAPSDPIEALQQAVLGHWQDHRNEPWQGFELNPGVSDRWVATAVLTLLAGAHREPWMAELWRQRFDQLLSGLEPMKPIGFSEHTPADADSTIWLQRLLLATGHETDATLAGFIAAHWRETGIATYRPDSGIAEFINRGLAECQGWLEPHDCVLANLSALPGGLQNRALTLLRRRVQAGVFASTWWPAPGWALALAPRGSLPIQAMADLVEQPMVGSTLDCLGTTLSERLWTFQRALALLRHGTREDRQKSSEVILDLVRSPLGFAQLACLQIPDPSLASGHTCNSWDLGTGLENSLNLDQKGHFSAALVSAALG